MDANDLTLAVLDKSSLMKLSKEEIADYAIRLSDLSTSIQSLKASFAETIAELGSRIEKTESELAISTRANELLAQDLVQLRKRVTANERATIRNGQYLCNAQIVLRRMPKELSSGGLKSYVADVLSLTGTDVNVDELDKCHPLGGDGDVILSFARREKRDAVLMGRRNLKNKFEDMKRMGAERIMILEHLTKEYAKMDYSFRSLKRRGVIEETWFLFGRLFVKPSKDGDKKLISHMEDIYDLFGRECVDKLFKLKL